MRVKKIMQSLKWVYSLYYDGFINMRVGKTLWLLIVLKLFIMFAIVKWLFFPNVLQEQFHTDKERSMYILNQLTKEQ